jgi:predicted nucleotidyltransferase
MLEREEIIEKIKERKSELRSRFSVTRIGLFGSYHQGAARETSDIDFLVDLSEPTFDHYMDLKFYHEDLFKRPVDVILTDTLKPRLKSIVKLKVSYA